MKIPRSKLPTVVYRLLANKRVGVLELIYATFVCKAVVQCRVWSGRAPFKVCVAAPVDSASAKGKGVGGSSTGDTEGSVNK